MVELRLLRAEQTYDLRSRVLRPGRPFEESHFIQDQDPQVFHVGAFFPEGDVAIGVATFAPEKNQDFFNTANLHPKNPYRLRGMAVDPQQQGKNIGRLILNFSEQELKARHCDLLWFNARESAFTFYQKLGYRFFGEMFEIPTVGAHKVMYKNLLFELI